MSIATQHEGKVRSTHIPPCFNYNYFYGVRDITLNEPMADLLASALMRSEYKTPLTMAIAKDLFGDDSVELFDDADDEVPSYSYDYFRNRGHLGLNKAGAAELAEAINQSGGGRTIQGPLWSLYHKLIYKPERHENVA